MFSVLTDCKGFSLTLITQGIIYHVSFHITLVISSIHTGQSTLRQTESEARKHGKGSTGC